MSNPIKPQAALTKNGQPFYPLTTVDQIMYDDGSRLGIDSELSSTSENPVQNKVVDAAISNLNSLVGNTTVSEQINSAIENKVDKVSGKGLSTNDYTTGEKNKLAGIAEGANKTIVDSELKNDSTNPVQNKVVNTAISNLNTLVEDKAPAGYITNTYTITTNEELNNTIQTVYSSMGDMTIKYIGLNISVSGLDLGGGHWHATIYKRNSNYGFIEARAYSGSEVVRHIEKVIYNGTWGSRWLDSGYVTYGTGTTLPTSVAPAGTIFYKKV